MSCHIARSQKPKLIDRCVPEISCVSTLFVAVSAVFEIPSAIGFGEEVEDFPAELLELLGRSTFFFEIREDEFDRVQIGRIGWQVTEFGTGGFNGLANSGDFVAGEIVHHDDVSGNKGGDQVLLNPRSKQGTVDRPFDGQRSNESRGA